MDVTVQILDEFAQTNALPRNALEDVRSHVIAERDRRRAVMLQRLRRIDTDRLRARLEEASIVAAVTDSAEWREALTSRVAHRVKRLTVAIQGAGQMYAAEQLHAVRIATKKLRYALELIADARLAPVRPLVNTLKRAQDTLGKLHDLQVIEQHVAAVQAMPPARRGAHDGGLKVIAGSLAGRVPASPRPLRQTGAGADPAARDVHGNHPAAAGPATAPASAEDHARPPGTLAARETRLTPWPPSNCI